MAKDEKKIDYNALGQSIDTTWGRSSTPSGASQSVKISLISEDKMKVMYITIVNLCNEREMIDLKKKYVDEADQIIDNNLKKVKENYKEITESAVKFKQVSDTDSFEIINLNIYNGKKTAYYRRTVVYEVS